MRKAVAFALLLCSSSPLAAQQALAPAPAPAAAEQPAPEPRPAPKPEAQPAREARTPTLQVSNEEWRESFRAEEAKEAEPVGSRGWWYIVAAVAVGVIIAAVILD